MYSVCGWQVTKGINSSNQQIANNTSTTNTNPTIGDVNFFEKQSHCGTEVMRPRVNRDKQKERMPRSMVFCTRYEAAVAQANTKGLFSAIPKNYRECILGTTFFRTSSNRRGAERLGTMMAVA